MLRYLARRLAFSVLLVAVVSSAALLLTLRRARRHHVGAGRLRRVGAIDRGRARAARARPAGGRAVRRVGVAGGAPRLRHVADVRPARGGAGGRARAEHARARARGARSRRSLVGIPLGVVSGSRTRVGGGRHPRGVAARALAAVARQFAPARLRRRAHRLAADRRHEVRRRGGGARLAGLGAPTWRATSCCRRSRWRCRSSRRSSASSRRRRRARSASGSSSAAAARGVPPGPAALARRAQAVAAARRRDLRRRVRQPAERVVRRGDRDVVAGPRAADVRRARSRDLYLVAGCAAAGGVFLAVGALLSGRGARGDRSAAARPRGGRAVRRAGLAARRPGRAGGARSRRG